MTASTAPPLSRLSQWFSRTLFGRKQSVCKVPILGVEGSGKSSLIITLGQYVSYEKLGHVSTQSMRLFEQLLPHVMQGQAQPATVRYTPFQVHVTRLREADGSTTDVDMLLSSEDIPGQDFRLLCEAVRNNPSLAVGGAGQGSDLLARFRDLLSDCDGFVFVVDLVRDLSPADFARDPVTHVGRAYADQVRPIMNALLLAERSNARLAHKPVFFVFSKPDLHRLPPARVASDFERLMAIPLGPLRSALVNVGHYEVQCAGWRMDQALGALGVERFLSDLAHAAGAVRSRPEGR